MHKQPTTARKALVPFCLFCTFLMIGWRFFPGYILLPNLVDYGIALGLASDRSAYGVLADAAEQRLGERGAVSYISAGLESQNPDMVLRTFMAVRALDAAHGETSRNRELFFLIADFFTRTYGGGTMSRDDFLARDQAVRYFFRQSGRSWFDAKCRQRLLDVFMRSLVEPEQRAAADYLEEREWFTSALTEAGLDWMVNGSELCEWCGDEEDGGEEGPE